MADKLYSDEYMTNNDYAIIGGLETEELNLLEKEFLLLISFNLYVSEEQFLKYCGKLRRFEESISPPAKTVITVENKTEIANAN